MKGYTYEEICKIVHLSVATVMARIKIAELEPEIQKYYVKGGLPGDYAGVAAIAGLPDSERVRVATSLGARHASRGTVLRVCNRVTMNYGGPAPRRRNERGRSQATVLADEPNSRMYTFLEKDGKIPAWEVVEKAASETCKACSLSGSASDGLCKDCPAVELVKRITKLVNEVKE